MQEVAEVEDDLRAIQSWMGPGEDSSMPNPEEFATLLDCMSSLASLQDFSDAGPENAQADDGSTSTAFQAAVLTYTRQKISGDASTGMASSQARFFERGDLVWRVSRHALICNGEAQGWLDGNRLVACTVAGDSMA